MTAEPEEKGSHVSAPSIKSMKLYNDVERIYNELTAAGLAPGAPLSVSDLSRFDQFHYHGTAAVDRAIADLDLGSGSTVAEIGSGIGGPARYIADRTGAQVTALELQPDLDALAQELTGRCGLDDRVTHLCGDILESPLPHGRFDAVVSWLALYHIGDRPKLFAQIAAALKPSGKLYVEDLSCRGPFTQAESDLLEVQLFGRHVVDPEEYRLEVETAGLHLDALDDMSDDWAAFTHDRLNAFRADRARHQQVHGAQVVEALEEFYGAVDRLFQGGHLGGLRLLARKV